MSDNIDYSSIEEDNVPIVPSFYDLPKTVQLRILQEAKLLEVRETNEVRENFDKVLKTRTFHTPRYPEFYIGEDGQPTFSIPFKPSVEFRRMQRRR